MEVKSEASRNARLADLRELHDRHLRIGRSPVMNALTRIRSRLLKSAREFFDQDGWLEVAPIPAISSLAGACEDFSTLFSLDYFGKRAFLIQTGQQHLEPFVSGPIRKVYTFNQSYRADAGSPERRLTAFLLMEAEAAHYTLTNIQETQERLLFKLCKDLILWEKEDLQELGADTSKLMNLAIPLKRISYSDAIVLLQQKHYSIGWGEDLKGEHEKALGEIFGQPFFVTNYPGSIKFFNMKDDPTDSRLVISSDLLVPGYGEIAGASTREEDYEKLATKLERFAQDGKRLADMQRWGINDVGEMKEMYHWYLELRHGNGVPHSGFGLGFERLVQWVCDFERIYEATEYPRNSSYLAP